VKDWGQDILEACQPFALKLDEANNTNDHTQSLENALERIQDPDKTPSARVLQDVEAYNGSYFDFIMDLSSRYTNKLKTDNFSSQTLNEYVSNAQSSITRQQDIEHEKQLEFEKFRRDYVSQEASRVILEENG
jgi:glutamate--cysteine ligase